MEGRRERQRRGSTTTTTIVVALLSVCLIGSFLFVYVNIVRLAVDTSCNDALLELTALASKFCNGSSPDNATDLFFPTCHTHLDTVLQKPYRLGTNIECRMTDGGNGTNVTLINTDTERTVCGKTPQTVSSPIQTFQFGDPCLKQYIQENCFDDGYSVPRVVHYVWFSNHTMDIYTFLSVLSAYRFLNPCLVLFHADYLPFGPYWRALPSLVPVLVHVNRTAPQKIFGKTFGYVQHQSDIARLEALQEYGGIYLDGDQLVLRDLDEFRTKPFVMGHENNRNLANSLILAQPQAKFIEVWYRSYKSYNPKQWGIHSTFLPLALSRAFRDLIHIAGFSFVKPDLPWIHEVWEGRYDWTQNHAIHLYVRSTRQWKLFKTDYTLDELKGKNSSLGEIARHILFGAKDGCFEKDSSTFKRTDV